MTWEPMFIKEGREVAIKGSEIISGAYDQYLISFAQEAKSWRRPLIIRLAHEMNLVRYHWGVERTDYGPSSPEIYRGLYRHVVDLFRCHNADNILWAFCPNAESQPHPKWDQEASWNQARHYYPGDDYVDLMGMDGYNWGTTQTEAQHGWNSRWQTFEEIFQPVYDDLRSISKTKPLVVFETACATRGGDKSQWIREALKKTRAR